MPFIGPCKQQRVGKHHGGHREQSMKMKAQWFGLVFGAGCLASSVATACNVAGSTEWVPNGNDCTLRASVSADSPAAATKHYRRADREATLRLSFVVAPAPALVSLDDTQRATLATGAALSVPAQGPPQASLFSVALGGVPSSAQPHLLFDAACASSAGVNGLCSAHVPVQFSDFPLRVTLELQMGAASAGRLQAWLGDDVSGAPAVSLDGLDNARWQGIDRVSLGLSSVSASMASAIGSQPFTFSEITVNEPQLFWNDFESELAGNITVDGAAIQPLMNVSGNTCLGTAQFPVIASGSTRLEGRSIVHPLQLGSAGNVYLDLIPSVPGMRLFACPTGSGPSGPCMEASANLLPLLLEDAPAGSYQIIVGNVDSNCGHYVISPAGSWN
jgi:hypothetical protein